MVAVFDDLIDFFDGTVQICLQKFEFAGDAASGASAVVFTSAAGMGGAVAPVGVSGVAVVSGAGSFFEQPPITIAVAKITASAHIRVRKRLAIDHSPRI